MSSIDVGNRSSTEMPGAGIVDMKLEVVVVPVSDRRPAKRFYETLGFREDIDYVGDDDVRVVQFTPPGSACSIIIGSGHHVGGARVDRRSAARSRARRSSAAASTWASRSMTTGDVFHHAGTEWRAPGPAPERSSYGSFASFSDPDGNGWLL
jgi:catechol 2,3-dioxygenase-like lactoylglutathione lyase family enzyme